MLALEFSGEADRTWLIFRISNKHWAVDSTVSLKLHA